MDAKETKQTTEAETGPFLRRVYGNNQYPNLQSYFCTLNVELHKKCIFKEGILHSKLLSRLSNINDPNYLPPKVIRKQPNPISTTPTPEASGIPKGTPVCIQHNYITPAYSHVVFDMAPASKPTAAMKANKYQLPPRQITPRVENNEEKIYRFETRVKEGKFRESLEEPFKKVYHKLQLILASENQDHGQHHTLRIVPQKVRACDIEL